MRVCAGAETAAAPPELLVPAAWQAQFFFVVVVVVFFCLFAISWAAPMAYGGSQARGLIGAVATSLRQNHSNTGFEPRLQPTPQFTATLDP